MRFPVFTIARRFLATNAAGVLRGSPLTVPKVPLHQFILLQMEKFVNRTCLIDKGRDRTYTFEQVIDISNRVGYGLRELGMRKGETMVIFKHNSADYVFGVLGGLLTGGTVCLINPASTVYELSHCFSLFKDKQPICALINPECLPRLQEMVTKNSLKLSTIVAADNKIECDVSMDSLASASRYISPATHSDIAEDTRTLPSFVTFSSGTTGLPKGILCSHYGALANLCSFKDIVHFGEIGIDVFPMCNELLADSLLKLIEGMTQVIYPKFDFEVFLKAVETFKPQSALLPPPVLVLLAKSPLVDKYDLSSLRKLVTGGAPTRQEVEDQCRTRLGNPAICQAYGTSEAGSVVMKRTADGHHKPGSTGTVVPGGELKVVELESGKALGPDELGEICLRGPFRMMEYLHNAEATSALFDSEGWMHTGDLGYYDSDHHTYCLDRIKELIKYKAYQVAPAEMDAIILDHPAVSDVGVVGVPDKMAGELPRAYVVRREGSEVTETDIHDFVAEKVPHYKRLRGGVKFIDAIPKLPSGKILRRNLREWAESE